VVESRKIPELRIKRNFMVESRVKEKPPGKQNATPTSVQV
jgi:hypothetical protein